MSRTSPSNIIVKNIDLSGAEGAALCATIHKEAFSPLDEEGWSAQAIEDLMASSGVHLLLAHIEGDNTEDAPAGFALYRMVAGEAELITLATLPAFQGQGVARALMLKMRLCLEDERVEKLFLEVRLIIFVQLNCIQTWVLKKLAKDQTTTRHEVVIMLMLYVWLCF
ncbi:GNAT family N-acetyltransferase [Kordiimonas sp.]|uniref:GNAT family N-acetyltransferase n=1 Tax=Kordiimonas sp. TaxID=1970157 RepID=UPI003B52F190